MIRHRTQFRSYFALICLVLLGCGVATFDEPTVSTTEVDADPTGMTKMPDESSLQFATFGAGCYWCTEAVFRRVHGVENVVSGFMGGTVVDPSYEAVCSGKTGHAEVIHFQFDPTKVSYEELLEVFWKTHDPTTLNQQGADRGPQYRSAVFYHNDVQRQAAETLKRKLDESQAFGKPIVTEITPASEFYAAKADHQNFYNSNPYNGYCGAVIRPKLDKFESVFADKLKREQ